MITDHILIDHFSVDKYPIFLYSYTIHPLDWNVNILIINSITLSTISIFELTSRIFQLQLEHMWRCRVEDTFTIDRISFRKKKDRCWEVNNIVILTFLSTIIIKCIAKFIFYKRMPWGPFTNGQFVLIIHSDNPFFLVISPFHFFYFSTFNNLIISSFLTFFLRHLFWL